MNVPSVPQRTSDEGIDAKTQESHDPEQCEVCTSAKNDRIAELEAENSLLWVERKRLQDALRCSIDVGARRLLLPSEVTHWQALLEERIRI